MMENNPKGMTLTAASSDALISSSSSPPSPGIKRTLVLFANKFSLGAEVLSFLSSVSERMCVEYFP